MNITWIESDRLKWPEAIEELERFDGILVPGGFGRRGVEGMLHAIRYAREYKVPYFGICLGMQTMVIEFARNVCGLPQANSTEFDPATPDRVIYKLRELKGVDELGGTMRLGAYPCLLAENSFARQAYGTREISERHRHRYEFNREYEAVLKQHGLRLTGETPDGVYVEICELPGHPWYLGCQFHPEFKSKPLEPHPLFRAFVGAALEHRRRRGPPSRGFRGNATRPEKRVTACDRLPAGHRRHPYWRRCSTGADRRALRHRKRGARPVPGY